MGSANTAVMTLTPKQSVEKTMAVMKAALPNVKAIQERFAQAALGMAESPGLAKCTPDSVIKAMYQCARLNLIPDPILQYVAIVPFRNKGVPEATLIVMYKGLIELAKRACPGISISTGTVYENDNYTLTQGTTEELKIYCRWWERDDNLNGGKREPGNALFHYAVAKTPDGEPTLEIVSSIEAKALGKKSKAGCKSGTPWHDHPNAMGEKTAIKRLTRVLQMSSDGDAATRFNEAVMYDERTEERPDLIDPTTVLDFDQLPPEGNTKIGKLEQPQEPSDG